MISHSLSKYKLHKAVTLVELLVAITISIIVLSMATNIYLSSKKIYRKVKSKADQDIKELTTKKILYDAIIDAGLSCKYGSKTQTYTNKTGDNLSSLKFIYDSSAVRIGKISEIGDYLRESLAGQCRGYCYQPDTDYIMVKNEDSFTTLLSKVNNLTLGLESLPQWSKGDYLALCNNNDVNVVKVFSVNKTRKSLNLSVTPSDEYDKGDYVGKYSIQIFYIGDSGSKDKNGSTLYSLYVYTKSGDNKAVTYPLISRVSDLRVSYSNLNNNQLAWRTIIKGIDLDDIKAKALKISFKVEGKHYNRVILL